MPRHIIPLSEYEIELSNEYFLWLSSEHVHYKNYQNFIEKTLENKIKKNIFDQYKAEKFYYLFVYKNKKYFSNSILLRAELLRNVAKRFTKEFMHNKNFVS
jgi:hypothetical protein